MAGTKPRMIYETVKWLQFPGAWSHYEIGTTGWYSHLSNPCFMKTHEDTWKSVDFAYSVHGWLSWWDNTLKWGYNPYTHVDAYYYYKPNNTYTPFGNVIFYPTQNGYMLPTNTLLWDYASGYNGGGGCPYLYVWNGQNYVPDNNLSPASELSNGADVKDYYKLEQSLNPTYHGTSFSLYSLQLREFEREHDYFDQMKFLAVDCDSDANVAVSPYGEILTYTNPDPPTSAFDETGINVLSLVNTIDGNYYQGRNGSYITLTFNHREILNGVKLVIRDDERPPLLKCPVNVQVLNATGGWNTVATFFTRTYWAIDIINMTAYLPDPEGNLKVRLCFIANDKIDYVGIDTSPQASVQIHQATLVAAIHSTQGNVKNLLLNDDQTYAELIPEQQIYLLFLLPNNQNEKRTFILYTEGHYSTIR